MTANSDDLLVLVGMTGFEPATTCTPCKCATRLRYIPNCNNYIERLSEKSKTFFIKKHTPENIFGSVLIRKNKLHIKIRFAFIGQVIKLFDFFNQRITWVRAGALIIKSPNRKIFHRFIKIFF